MRTILAAGALLAAAVLAPVAVTATETPICQPNPLSHSHPGWVRVPNTAVDLGGPAPASATNPLMQGFGSRLPVPAPASESVVTPVNPLTHRP